MPLPFSLFNIMDTTMPERPVSPTMKSLHVARDADLHMDVHMRGLRLDWGDIEKSPKATQLASGGAPQGKPKNFADLHAGAGSRYPRPLGGHTAAGRPERNTSSPASESPQIDFVSN